MSKSKGYVDVDYLKLAAELTRPAKEGSYAAMHLQPGYYVLDAGCGPGTDTLRLAEIVGAEGMVVGIDYDPEMVAEADERAKVAGLNLRVIHQVGNALELPFTDHEFDATRSERLFEHLLQPEIALAEMTRVTKANGWVVVLDTDWGTISINSPFTDLERRLARVHAEHGLNNAYSGRRLPNLFKQQGFQNITVQPYSLFTTQYGFARLIATLDQSEADAIRLGIATEEEIATWRADLEKLDAAGAFYASLGMVLVSGQKAA